MPHFYPDILNLDELNVLGSIAYATRCARRVLPLDPEFSQVSLASSAADRAVVFGELCVHGEEVDHDELDRVLHLLDDKARWMGINGSLYVVGVFQAAGDVARLAQRGKRPFKLNSPGTSSRVKAIRALAKSAIESADRSINEWVTANSLPRAFGMFSIGQTETPEYIFENACKEDLNKLRQISNSKTHPEWGRDIDASEDGPLGSLWPRGVPKEWPKHVGIFGSDRITLLLNAIVHRYGNSSEGSLIHVIAPPFREILRHIESDPNFLFEFTRHPRKFEEFIAGAYDRAGYDEVTLTPQRNDGGRDVIAVKKGFGSVRILEQTKAYSEHRRVTHAEVREMLGTLSLDCNASKGIVTTTADFQPGITLNNEIARFMPHRLELKNGQQLREFLLTLRDNTT